MYIARNNAINLNITKPFFFFWQIKALKNVYEKKFGIRNSDYKEVCLKNIQEVSDVRNYNLMLFLVNGARLHSVLKSLNICHRLHFDKQQHMKRNVALSLLLSVKEWEYLKWRLPILTATWSGWMKYFVFHWNVICRTCPRLRTAKSKNDRVLQIEHFLVMFPHVFNQCLYSERKTNNGNVSSVEREVSLLIPSLNADTFLRES